MSVALDKTSRTGSKLTISSSNSTNATVTAVWSTQYTDANMAGPLYGGVDVTNKHPAQPHNLIEAEVSSEFRPVILVVCFEPVKRFQDVMLGFVGCQVSGAGSIIR